MIRILDTTEKDLDYIRSLWADPEVMKFVGFPEGLIVSMEQMEKWYEHNIEAKRPFRNHYCIFDDDKFLGETYYDVDVNSKKSSLDIKLFPFARGKSIAFQALSYAISKAFEQGAEIVYVDPAKENLKAINLYKRLNFIEKDMPLDRIDYKDTNIYMEIEKKDWKS